MNESQATALFDHNIETIKALADGSRSAIKGLLMDCEKNRIYIRLTGAAGHRVSYVLEEGSQMRLDALCQALHLDITENTIEAKH